MLKKNNINDSNVKYIVSDFITDNLPDKDYDLVISSYALHHIRNEDNLKEVFIKIANILKEDIGTFICVDMYLETGMLERKKQEKRAIDEWARNFGSIDQAFEWAEIIKSEDTPATIPTILASLYQCRAQNINIIPLLTNQSGDMATVYGMTKLSLEEINKCGLYDLVWSWRDNELPIGVSQNEYKIDNLQFDDNPSDNNVSSKSNNESKSMHLVVSNEIIDLYKRDTNLEGYYDIYLHDTNTCIGYLGVQPLENNCNNIAYKIDDEYRGNNYIIEALSTLITYLSKNGVENIVIISENNNKSSIRVIEKIHAIIPAIEIKNDGNITSYYFNIKNVLENKTIRK